MPTALNILSKSAEVIENRIKTTGDGQGELVNGEEKERAKAKPKTGEQETKRETTRQGAENSK